MRLPFVLLATVALTPLFAETPAATPAVDEVALRFKAMDGDRDGFVTVSEQLAYLLAKHAAGRELTEEQNAAVAQIAKALVADADADKDGRVSLAELRSPGRDGLASMFKSADADNDGYASLDEMRVSVRHAMLGDKIPDAAQSAAIEEKAQGSLTLFDFDGDGRVSFVELRRFMEIEASAPNAPTMDDAAVQAFLEAKPDFAAIDLDENGYLTPAELTAWGRVRLRHAGPQYQDAFRQKSLVLLGYDTDGDSRISRKEWDAGANARSPETDGQRIDRLVEAFAALSFDDLDADKDGVVAESEINAATARLAKGAPPKDALGLQMIAALNLTKRKGPDGKITRASWAAATERAQAERMKERIAERFKEMDKNADGFVVADELVAYMTGQSEEAPTADKLRELREEAVSYIATTDRNADKKLDLEEYATAVIESQREQDRAEKQVAAVNSGLSDAQRKEFAGRHHAMDGDGDGRVTHAEMSAYIKHMATEKNGGNALTAGQNDEVEKRCGEFVKELDTDGDKSVSLDEYLAAMAKSE